MPLPGSDPKGGSFQKWVNILGEIGKLKAEPDTDPEFAQQVEEMILAYVKPQLEAQDPAAQMAQMLGVGAEQGGLGAAPSPQAPPGGSPVEMAQAPTRLPRHRGNPVEQMASIERDLAGNIR